MIVIPASINTSEMLSASRGVIPLNIPIKGLFSLKIIEVKGGSFGRFRIFPEKFLTGETPTHCEK